MHELSIAQGIMQIVEAEREKHGFQKVGVIHLRAGALSGIDQQALQFAFEVVREGTCAAEATIDLQTEQRVLRCRKCGATAAADSGPKACPECGSIDLSFEASMALDIVSLEVDSSG